MFCNLSLIFIIFVKVYLKNKNNEVNLKKNFLISIDMGGTKILASVLNSEEGIIARVKKATENTGNQNHYVADLTEVINDVIKEAGLYKERIKAIVLGVPGSVDPYTGVVGLAPNLGLKNFAIKEKLEKNTGLPILIENDVNLAALGIKKFELNERSRNILVAFVGTGIGGALMFDEKIYRGSNYVAGEIGHRVIQPNGPLCGCGNRGCFEAVASRTAIVRNISDDIKKHKKSIITKLVKPGEKIKSKTIATAVKKNDKLVVTHISNATGTIGLVLANINNLLNLDTIVLGGGLIEALHGFMLPKIKKSFKENSLKDASKTTRIVETKLGDDAALWGGIPLAEEFLKLKI
jgi:glucokinase